MSGRGRAAAVAAVLALAAACGGAGEERRGEAAEPAVRLWASPIVRWEPGARRAVGFALENPTNRTVHVASPDPANARVDVYAGADGLRVCGAAPVEPPAPGPPVALAPGDRLSVRVDLEAACGGVPPGEYRFEVGYRAAAPAGADAFSGTLAARHGQVLVSGPGTSGEAVSRGGVEPSPPEREPARRGRAPGARGGRGRRAPAPAAAPAPAPEGR
ncbi:MAG TPA: hypothetical protein VFL83_00375 [Anaeromyxobacter sp.]|nr:hypothetical protein [Anaeromyxobacter sp.]